jgi:hypothetical protein
MANAATDVALAHTGRAEDQDRRPFLQPGVAARERHDVGLREHRYLGELEAGQRLGRIELRLGAMAFDTPLGAFGQFVFEQCTQEAARRPALLVGALGKLRPQSADCRQAQLAQHQRDASRLAGRGVHATSSGSSSCSLGSNAS